MLENDEIMKGYSISVKNKFSALGQLNTIEERWQKYTSLSQNVEKTKNG